MAQARAWAQLDSPTQGSYLEVALSPRAQRGAARRGHEGHCSLQWGASCTLPLLPSWTWKSGVGCKLELTQLCPEAVMELGRGVCGHSSPEMTMLPTGSGRWGGE